MARNVAAQVACQASNVRPRDHGWSLGESGLYHFSPDHLVDGVGRLSEAITIDGSTVLPTFRYTGADFAAGVWPGWGYGSNLEVIGTGGDPFDFNSPFHGVKDGGVGHYASGKQIASTSLTEGNISTLDGFLIALILTPNSSNAIPFGKIQTGPNIGWDLNRDSATTMGIYLRTSGTAPNASAAIGNGVLALVCASWNRDATVGGLGLWFNKTRVAQQADISAKAAENLDHNTPLKINGYVGGGTSDGAIFYAALYLKAGWFANNFTGRDAFVESEFNKLVGVDNIYSRGTKTPLGMTRASAANIVKRTATGKKYFFNVYNNWPRLERLASGRRAYLRETTGSNIQLNGLTMSTWGVTNTVRSLTAGPVSPYGYVKWTRFIEDTATGYHFTASNTYGTVSANDYLIVSAMIKRSSRRYLFLSISRGETGTFNGITVDTTDWASLNPKNTAAEFDAPTNINFQPIDTDSIATATEAIVSFKIKIKQASSFLAVQLFILNGADIATAGSYAGDPTTYPNGIYALDAMVEVALTGQVLPSSRLPTQGAAVTRASERLYFKADDGAVIDGKGKIEVEFQKPLEDEARACSLFALSVSGGANDNIIGSVNASDGLTVATRKTGGDNGDVTINGDFSDGTPKKVIIEYQGDHLKMNTVSAAAVAADTSCDIPTGLNQIEVGGDNAGVNEFNGHILSLKILEG